VVSVCRLSIQTDLDGDVRTVDVAVSAQTPVGLLLPAINDVARLWPAADGIGRWRLDRPAGGPLDDSMSLEANGVHDGTLLVLSEAQAPTLEPAGREPARLVASAGDRSRECDGPLRDGLCTWVVLAAAAALTWSGTTTHAVVHLIVAACGACAVCWIGSLGRSPTLPVAGVALAAATGFLAVPSGPGAPNVLLAAAAAFAASVVLARSSWPSAVLTATATSSALIAAATAVASFVALPVATTGAALGTAAVGLLALAPRAAILLSGLSPRRDDRAPSDAARDAARASDGHATLTGLVAGSATAMVAGMIQVAVGCLRDEVPAVAGVAFMSAVGLATLLRSRTYVDASRRIALAIGGLLSASVALLVVVAVAPGYSCWIAVTVTALGLGLRSPRKLTAVTKRTVDLIDYAALAAVVPLACWVIGVYGLARNLQLT
jgi:type VII secretion integral membrane protein EccD